MSLKPFVGGHLAEERGQPAIGFRPLLSQGIRAGMARPDLSGFVEKALPTPCSAFAQSEYHGHRVVYGNKMSQEIDAAVPAGCDLFANCSSLEPLKRRRPS